MLKAGLELRTSGFQVRCPKLGHAASNCILQTTYLEQGILTKSNVVNNPEVDKHPMQGKHSVKCSFSSFMLQKPDCRAGNNFWIFTVQDDRPNTFFARSYLVSDRTNIYTYFFFYKLHSAVGRIPNFATQVFKLKNITKIHGHRTRPEKMKKKVSQVYFSHN